MTTAATTTREGMEEGTRDTAIKVEADTTTRGAREDRAVTTKEDRADITTKVAREEGTTTRGDRATKEGKADTITKEDRADTTTKVAREEATTTKEDREVTARPEAHSTIARITSRTMTATKVRQWTRTRS